LCTVSAADGGGSSPSKTSGACPSSTSYPSWYHATGQSQAPNIETGDTCNFSGGGCYVFTDRGTFSYLQSTNAIVSLKIVTRDNAPTSPGGSNLLVNSFHAYAVNPARFPPGVAARIKASTASEFLSWVTSPAAQTAISGYLDATKDAPFRPDAAPVLSGAGLPAKVIDGGKVTLTGTLTNVTPGTPPLSDQPVTLYVRHPRTKRLIPVATTRTTSTGTWSFSYKPSVSGTYSVATGVLTQVEDARLSPSFTDLLAPTTATLGSTVVIDGTAARTLTADPTGPSP
jgi:tungstate transport system substrate-binding protein